MWLCVCCCEWCVCCVVVGDGWCWFCDVYGYVYDLGGCVVYGNVGWFGCGCVGWCCVVCVYLFCFEVW